MNIDQSLLEKFEAGLDPQNPASSAVKCKLIGFGEISAIFEVEGQEGMAMKRLPIFPDRPTAEQYIRLYDEYCVLIGEAGIRLPETATAIAEVPGRPVVIYIAQERLPSDRFCNHLIHVWELREIKKLIANVVDQFKAIWRFTESHKPALEIAIDGQLSNWVVSGSCYDYTLNYIDTSTPFIRRHGNHQIPADLFLQAVPRHLRGIFRSLFLSDVLNRYYDRRSILIDLAANLYKEQRPDLVPVAVQVINNSIGRMAEPITVEAVKRYYREDKMIWQIFLAIRKIDRWTTTSIRHGRYEFILPDKIKR